MNEFKTFDIEAYNWNEIYAIGVYDGRSEPLTFYPDMRGGNREKSNALYIEWLFNNLETDDVVYAHNGGRYDFLFIMDYVIEGKAKLSRITTINGSIASMVIKAEGKTITFKDSYMILPASLLRLTNDFDVIHKKQTLDYGIGTKDAGFEDYFRADLMGLHEVISESGLSGKLTLASNAIDYFMQGYTAPMSRNTDIIDSFFRNAYYGGRVEVIKQRGQNLNYYDVNSIYPYVMAMHEYPLPIKNNFYEVNEYVENAIGIYECDVVAPNMHIPVLPVKHEGKLIFPIGRFSGVWCSPELELAKEKGYQIKVKRGYVFSQTDKLFDRYVNTWYDVKKNSKGAKKAVAKLMLNSLYGKFGQRRIHKDLIPVYNRIPKETTLIGSLVFETKEIYDSYSLYLHSEISALITSYARAYLYRLIERAGVDNVYYYDTDSIITSSLLNTDDLLGGLKEEAQIDDFIGLSPKLYAYKSDGKVSIRAKGLRVNQLNYDKFIKAWETKDYSGISADFEKVSSFKEGIRYGYGIFTKVKTMRRNYKGIDNKRLHLDNANTAPLHLNTPASAATKH